jgi:hypothetical protein
VEKNPAKTSQVTMHEAYLNHFSPLIQEFIREIKDLPIQGYDKLPEPFFPLYGSRYESSRMRLVIVGQDTKGWGGLHEFVGTGSADSAACLRSRLSEFQSLEFTKWGKNRHHFFGFVMMLLAALEGEKDWQILKRHQLREALESFAWANGNSIEYYESSAKSRGIPKDLWNAVRSAGARFDGFAHLVQTIRPRVAIVLWKRMNSSNYFKGCQWSPVDGVDGVRRYKVDNEGESIDVLHVPHPGRMKFENGANFFCGQLTALLQQHKLEVPFPEYMDREPESGAVQLLLKQSAPSNDGDRNNFRFVAWVAVELGKRQVSMSVPALSKLLNDCGRKTTYGTPYLGGRGTYRLVRGAYHWLDRTGKRDDAIQVAQAFRRPNFDYAYNTES